VLALFDKILGNDLITVVKKDHKTGSYIVRLGCLKTAITIQLTLARSKRTAFKVSHAVMTTLMKEPYCPPVAFGEDPTHALFKAIGCLIDPYRDAINARLIPSENWLVPRQR